MYVHVACNNMIAVPDKVICFPIFVAPFFAIKILTIPQTKEKFCFPQQAPQAEQVPNSIVAEEDGTGEN